MLKTLKLTDAELNMILSWIESNYNQQWYYGIKTEYFARAAKIKAKVERAKRGS